MATPPNISMRLPADLVAWATQYLQELEGPDRQAPSRWDRTELFRELLMALRDRRLVVTSTPVQYINDGSRQELPVLVCLHQRWSS